MFRPRAVQRAASGSSRPLLSRDSQEPPQPASDTGEGPLKRQRLGMTESASEGGGSQELTEQGRVLDPATMMVSPRRFSAP